MAIEREDYRSAWDHCKEAYTIARQESFSAALPIFANNLASTACLLDDLPAARSYNLESLKYCEELGHKTSIGGGLNVAAALAVQAGEAERSARLFGAADSIYDANAYKVEKADQWFNDRYIDKARDAIGDEGFEAAFAEGRSLSIKEAIALAREGEK